MNSFEILVFSLFMKNISSSMYMYMYLLKGYHALAKVPGDLDKK